MFKQFRSFVFYFTCSAIIISIVGLACIDSTFAQETIPKHDAARALLNSSMDFLRQKLEQSGYSLTEQDFQQIKREGNTFLIPKHLRLKGLTNLPVIERQIAVKRISIIDPNDSKENSPKKIPGYQINSIKSKSIFISLGLIKGDILHKINDEIIRDSNTATAIFNKLKLSDSITVTLIRNQSLINYIYKFV